MEKQFPPQPNQPYRINPTPHNLLLCSFLILYKPIHPSPSFKFTSKLSISAFSMLASSPTSFLQYPFQTTLHKQPPCLRFRRHKTVAAFTATGAHTTETEQLHFRARQMASTVSLYEVLGIPMSASCHEIKAAYRRLARMCHPDVVAINQKETSANEFIKIHSAYSTLSDPDKRASYDREIYRYRPRPYGSSSAAMATAMSGFSGFTSRNWETDQCW